MTVEKIVSNGNSREDVYEYIAKLASVVRDKDPKSGEKLFGRLLVESVGKRASRVLEYIPCRIDVYQVMSNIDSNFMGQLFGFFNEEQYFTNARELLDWGWELDDVLESACFDNYAVYKCEAPYFIYGQVSTHNQLTTVSHSQRFAECDRGYWKPPEVEVSQDVWNIIVKNISKEGLALTMKQFGITRKEVWDRGSDMLQNRVFTIGGYTNNDNAWEHFVKERTGIHTQKETVDFTNMLNEDLKISV